MSGMKRHKSALQYNATVHGNALDGGFACFNQSLILRGQQTLTELCLLHHFHLRH